MITMLQYGNNVTISEQCYNMRTMLQYDNNVTI